MNKDFFCNCNYAEFQSEIANLSLDQKDELIIYLKLKLFSLVKPLATGEDRIEKVYWNFRK